MPLQAFDGVYTARQIVGLARRRVGNPDLHLNEGGGEGLDAPAYLELQSILDHLALTWDWPFKRIICEFPVSTRTTNLPNIAWRTSFADPVFIKDPDTGQRHQLHLLSEEQFYTRNLNDTEKGQPIVSTIRKSDGTISVDPIPNRTYTVSIHLQPWQIPLSDTESKPWFPWSEYLVAALAEILAMHMDDSRVQAESAKATRLMAEIRRGINDKGDRTTRLKLDPTIYRRPLRF